MFKFLAVVCCIAVTMTMMIQGTPLKVSNKFDNINVDEILNNDRLLANYHKCLMDAGKCTPEGEELKAAIPEALTNKCAECSDKHKEATKKVIKFLSDKKPDLWKELVGKYDPEGIYSKNYLDEAKKLDIKL